MEAISEVSVPQNPNQPEIPIPLYPPPQRGTEVDNALRMAAAAESISSGLYLDVVGELAQSAEFQRICRDNKVVVSGDSEDLKWFAARVFLAGMLAAKMNVQF